MATPIYLNISDVVSESDSVSFKMSRFSVRPSDSIPVTESIEIALAQFPTEPIVMQELVSSFLYETPSSTYYIGAETAVGVIPQVGSAIYTRWDHRLIKESQVTRAMHSAVADPEETGRERISGLRNYWSLEINVGASQADTMWAFILSHYGAGIPFYFYDLQNNNFFYDGTGVSTNGRYMVRLVPESFSRNQQQGSRQYARFVIAYDVIEVGA